MDPEVVEHQEDFSYHLDGFFGGKRVRFLSLRYRTNSFSLTRRNHAMCDELFRWGPLARHCSSRSNSLFYFLGYKLPGSRDSMHKCLGI